MDFAEALIAELDGAPCWPLPREEHARRACSLGRAFRKGDTRTLADHAEWDRERKYVHDPLARRIAFGFADFLFAKDTEFKAPKDGDQDVVNQLVEVNNMQARCHRAERVVVSEGETYWKLHLNAAVAAFPLLTFCSRTDVVPLFDGDRLLAVAFVTERHREMGRNENNELDSEADPVVFRHAEIHTNGRLLNVLYRGTNDTLGRRVELTAIAVTAAYLPDWNHGLPMLAGRVVNDLDDDDTLGVSEYEAIMDLLLALDEAVTIVTENARLTGQDRVVVDGKLRTVTGDFDASMQVFEYLAGEEGGTLAEAKGVPPVFAIEKTFEADALWTHIERLVKTTVSRVGLVAEFVGEGGDGQAESGTARRLRFMPTTNASEGKAREWDRALPHIIDLMLRLIPAVTGGSPVTGDGETPSVELSDPIPRDESETTTDVMHAAAAGAMSTRTRVKTLHPDWDEAMVTEEVTAIHAEESAAQLEPPPPPAA